MERKGSNQMGYTMLTGGLAATLSRHNSPRDGEHDVLWAEMCARIKAIVEEPKYRAIIADFWFSND